MAVISVEGIELDFSRIQKGSYTLPDRVSNHLKNQLLPEEHIELTLRGGWGTESRGGRSGEKISGGLFETKGKMWGHSWFILTNKRIILTTMGVVTTDTRDFSYANISSVNYESGFLTERLTIHAMSSVEDILFYKDVVKISRKLPSIIRSRIEMHHKENKVNSSVEDPLHILKIRLAKGEISKEEYEQIKKDLGK